MSRQIRIGLTPTIARKVLVTFKGGQPPMVFDVPLDATEFVITEQMLGPIADWDPWPVEVQHIGGGPFPMGSQLSVPCGGFVGDQQGQPHDRKPVGQPAGAVLLGYEDVE